MIPTLLIGAPGTGKTAWLRAHAEAEGKTLVYLPLAERDPLEVAGGMVADHRSHRLRWYPSDVAHQIATEPCVLVLDELTTATRAQRVVALRYADGTAALHPATEVWGAMNPPDMAAGVAEALTPPELARWAIRAWPASHAVEWLAGQPGETGRIGQYLAAHPAAALADAETIARAVDDQMPYPTPRGWHRAAGLDDAAMSELVGAAAIAGWAQWREHADLPDPARILAGARVAPPARADHALATATAVASCLLALPDPVGAQHVAHALAWFADAARAGQAGVCALALGRLVRPHAAALHAWLGTAGTAYSTLVAP